MRIGILAGNCILIFFLLIPITAKAGVTDSNVKRWLVGALENQSPVNDLAADKSLKIPRSSSTLRSAWSKLKECRDDGNSLDLDLASAEHYLFIRAFAAEKGSKSVEGLPDLYGKLKDMLGPAANLIKTSDQPVSPVDEGVVKWGRAGVAAGLADYQKNTGKAPEPASDSVAQFKLAVEGYYENYTNSVKNPKCKVAI